MPSMGSTTKFVIKRGIGLVYYKRDYRRIADQICCQKVVDTTLGKNAVDG